MTTIHDRKIKTKRYKIMLLEDKRDTLLNKLKSTNKKLKSQKSKLFTLISDSHKQK